MRIYTQQRFEKEATVGQKYARSSLIITGHQDNVFPTLRSDVINPITYCREHTFSIISLSLLLGPSVASCFVDFLQRWATFGTAATVVF